VKTADRDRNVKIFSSVLKNVSITQKSILIFYPSTFLESHIFVAEKFLRPLTYFSIQFLC
jgi:hypothetical protein